jgi:hypothetical protein
VQGEDVPVPAVHAAQRVEDGAALVGGAAEGKVWGVAVGLSGESCIRDGAFKKDACSEGARHGESRRGRGDGRVSRWEVIQLEIRRGKDA